MSRSPFLDLPGAVAGNGIDAPVAAHYGSFNTEQRTLTSGDGFVDLSHHGVVRISGPDRLEWLHSLTTQYFQGLEPGVPVQALILSPQGHVEHEFRGTDDGEAFTAHVEPGLAPALVDFLDRMRFMMRVEVADLTDQLALAWRPLPERSPGAEPLPERSRGIERSRGAGKYDLVPRGQLEQYAAAAGPACGLWAFEALRIARGEPRFGLDTDHRTIPNEVGWVPAEGAVSAVHLDKGCYRGQETVARVHTLGRPPRRLTLLHLDGSENRLPKPGAPVLLPRSASEVEGPSTPRSPSEAEGSRAHGKEVGFVGSSARHHELGPIALGLLKRNVSVDAELLVDGIAAAQEVVVDPEIGLHVRPLR